MMSPHPPKLRMKRRKTVSVTPAMGARTVAGAILTPPIMSDGDTGVHARTAAEPTGETPISPLPELSQNLRTNLFYCLSANRGCATIRTN